MRYSQVLPACLFVCVACGTKQDSPAATPPPMEEAATTKPSVTPVPKPPLSPESLSEARLLLSRLTWGARPGEVEKVAQALPEFRTQQLVTTSKPLGINRRFPVLGDEATLVSKFPRKNERMESDMMAQGDHRDLLRMTQERALVLAVEGDGGFSDLLTDFWFNHLNVYASKGFIRYVVLDYEKKISDEVFGNFGQMLLKSAQHPAMLMYLDNANSVRNGFRNGRGLNENYGRELLELHTLGQGNGYSQKDVTETARVLTGWNLRKKDDAREFIFRNGAHDKGTKTIMGQQYPPGIESAKTLLSRLATDQRTAARISKKLIERFVSKPAPEALIARLSKAYVDNNADLQPVMALLVASTQESATPLFKSPLEFVVSASRLVGAKVKEPKPMLQSLRRMKMLPYDYPVPTGYPTGQRWLSTSNMLERARFAKMVAFDEAGLEFDLTAVVTDADSSEDVILWAETLVGSLSEDTKKVIQPLFGNTEDKRRQRLMTLLASPEFMIR